MRRLIGIIEDSGAGLLLAAALGIVFLEMTARGAFQTSFMWSDELSRYLLIWMTYLGASALVREGGHIRVELLLNNLSSVWRRRFEFLIVLLCLVFTAVVFVAGVLYVGDSWSMGMMSADSNLPVPLWVFHAAIPVSYLLMSIHLGWRGWQLLSARPLATTNIQAE